MVLDRTNDAIVHFIGYFDLKVEQLRLRDVFEVFKAKRDAPELEAIETVNVVIPSDFELVQSTAKPLTYSFPVPPPHPTLPPVASEGDMPKELGTPGDPAQGTAPFEPPVPQMALPPLEWIWPDPPLVIPGSMVTVTIQSAYLSDNDRLGDGLFRDISVSIADLAALSAFAGALHVPLNIGPAEIPSTASIEALISTMEPFSVEGPSDFVVNTLRGEDVPKQTMNGVEMSDIPRWKDILPAHHASDDEMPGTDGDAAVVAERAFPREYTPNTETPDGFSLIAGGNYLVNQVVLSVSHVDAPLIAVAGTWTDIDLISQVSAITNRDFGSGAQPAPSTVVQTVVIDETSAPAFWHAGRDMNGEMPSMLQLSVIEGDLFVSNYVEQVIEMLDNDMFGMSFSSASASYILGDNTVFNSTWVAMGGFAYDLILVGGNLVSMNVVQQTQLLLEDDWIEASLPVESHGNQSFQDLGPIQGPTEAITEAHSSDVDEPSKWDAAPDNLLMSEARLTSIGVDVRAELSQSLASLMADEDASLDTLKERLLNDPALAGLEQARVLMVDGDLIQLNTIKQIIKASDRDDIRIDGNAPEDLDLIVGSNALLNSAAIAARGVDSVVMTQEEGYSELMLHQARLIDEPGWDETSGQGLTSEAVAFLMDETEEAINQQLSEEFAGTNGTNGADHYDVMNSVFA